VQDEGSQRIAELVDANGATVIDACAGEGGKTLALAALGAKKIIACDISAKKLEVLQRRARRAGFTNIQTIAIEREGALRLPQVDRVLVDAPCSGIGTLRRNPEMRHRIDPDMPTRLSREQREIAIRFAAFASRLIYATCTILKQEDEESVEAIAAATRFEVRSTMRLFPHIDHTDGFFAAVLQRGV
jgi:16S rRNA (cytosine967-C5)-methyltransferase